jgi:hypothetical protein
MATTADRVTKVWQVTAPPPFWGLLAWASVELGQPEGETVRAAIILLVGLLREIRAGNRVVVLDEAGDEAWELTAGNMVP